MLGTRCSSRSVTSSGSRSRHQRCRRAFPGPRRGLSVSRPTRSCAPTSGPLRGATLVTDAADPADYLAVFRVEKKRILELALAQPTAGSGTRDAIVVIAAW